jgi:hypothetical protein
VSGFNLGAAMASIAYTVPGGVSPTEMQTIAKVDRAEQNTCDTEEKTEEKGAEEECGKPVQRRLPACPDVAICYISI